MIRTLEPYAVYLSTDENNQHPALLDRPSRRNFWHSDPGARHIINRFYHFFCVVNARRPRDELSSEAKLRGNYGELLESAGPQQCAPQKKTKVWAGRRLDGIDEPLLRPRAAQKARSFEDHDRHQELALSVCGCLDATRQLSFGCF